MGILLMVMWLVFVWFVVVYECDIGVCVVIMLVGGVDVVWCVCDGELFDVVVFVFDVIEWFVVDGYVELDSCVDVVCLGIVVVVVSGVWWLDIGMEVVLCDVILGVGWIGYLIGLSGMYLMCLFVCWGIVDVIVLCIV